MSQAPAKVGNGRTAPGRVHPRENSRRTRLDGERGGNGAGGAPHRLSDLINDNAALSAEMALRIEQAFGVKMERLLRCKNGTTPTPCDNGPARSPSSPTGPLPPNRADEPSSEIQDFREAISLTGLPRRSFCWKLGDVTQRSVIEGAMMDDLAVCH
jgi:hypothetical protein